MARFTLPYRIAACTLLALGVAQAAAQQRFDFATAPGRLSKQVVPSFYRLALDVDPARGDFGGRVDITVKVSQPQAAIVLHAHELNATSAVLVAGGAPPRELDVAAEPPTQTWRLVPRDGAPIQPGDYQLQIAYTGSVQRSGSGLYLAEYLEVASEDNAPGQRARMLATQLEPIYARQVFPGFDEPAFRAAFELTVRAPQGLQVLGNMPLAERQPDGGATLHRFKPTPSMPGYLLALAVGRFDSLEGSAAGVPLRIVTATGKAEQARYALEAAQQLLPYYTDYFGVPFALPKLDQLAVPSTRWGAMEDWGLISYAEGLLLFDPARSSPATRRLVFDIMAHEVAHQWFGNLVTAASWEEIWLNEAFATWMATRATEHFNPAWHAALRERLNVDFTMTGDAGRATRAIRSGAVSETRVRDVFDDVTYVKGGAVLGMLEQWIGPQAFRRGLAAYMAERQYSNATAGDLWFHIGRAAGRDVAGVAASWTDQIGFPLLRVQTRCVAGQTQVQLQQSRFSLGPADRMARTWQIPVTLARGTQTSTVLLAEAQQTVELPGCPAEPLVANAGGVGFYRVQYSPGHLRALTRHFDRLNAADRVGLLSDSFALVLAGRLPLAGYFELLAATARVHDDSRAVLLEMANKSLEFLDAAMAGSPAQQTVRAATRALLAPELARLGWQPAPGENTETEALRELLIKRLAQSDHAPTIAQAQRLFDLDESGQSPLPGAIRSAVLRAVGTHADGKRFEQLLARLKAATSDEDRWTFAKALAAGRDAGRAHALMQFGLAGAIPPNVASSLPGHVGTLSPFGEAAYRFTIAQWPALAKLAGQGGEAYLLPSAAQQFNTPKQAEALIADQQRLVGEKGAKRAAAEADRIRLRGELKGREARGLGRSVAALGGAAR